MDEPAKCFAAFPRSVAIRCGPPARPSLWTRPAVKSLHGQADVRRVRARSVFMCENMGNVTVPPSIEEDGEKVRNGSTTISSMSHKRKLINRGWFGVRGHRKGEMDCLPIQEVLSINHKWISIHRSARKMQRFKPGEREIRRERHRILRWRPGGKAILRLHSYDLPG